MIDSMARVGELLGEAARGKALATAVRAGLSSLPRPETAPKTLLVFSHQGASAWVAGPSGWLGELALAAGLKLAFTEGPDYLLASPEQLRAASPDLIIELLGPQEASDELREERSARWRRLRMLTKAKLRFLAGGVHLRPGPGMLATARQFAEFAAP